VRPWNRRLSDGERSVLLSELLLRHPELVAEAEQITSTLLVLENDQELADEITAKLRALRPSGPVSVDAGRARVLEVLQQCIDDLTWRKDGGAALFRRALLANPADSCIGHHDGWLWPAVAGGCLLLAPAACGGSWPCSPPPTRPGSSRSPAAPTMAPPSSILPPSPAP
jgi:hypothetical protein